MSLLSVHHLSKSYGSTSRNTVYALKDVSLDADDGTTTGIVGESGSGKSTLLRCVMRLNRPDSGEVVYDGIDVLHARGGVLKRFHREVQMVFQDPYSSLNPRMTVEQLIGEGLIIHSLEKTRAGRRRIVEEQMASVGLNPSDMTRYPRHFSGGQRQRIAIARALAVRPRLLVCDEPVSALDVSVQAQVINLLMDLQKATGICMLFVAHNLAVVRQLCPTVSVLSNGEIVEEGTRDQIFNNPQHPYTRALLRAVPVPDPRVPFAQSRTLTEV